MTEYNVFRQFEEGLSRDELDNAVGACGQAIAEMRAEGADLTYLGSEVLLDDEGAITGSVCCFDGESREQVETVNDRAGIPYTTTYRRGVPVEGEAPKSS
jgi:hypothetical protein